MNYKLRECNLNDLKLVDFNQEHKKELNLWQDIEKQAGNNGLDSFVVASGTKLGDYIEFFTNQIELYSKIALDGENIVGFVCYVVNDNKSAHIEMVGVSPKFRKKGYSKKILDKTKKEIEEKFNIRKVTLAVHKKNEQGLKSFSKFAKQTVEKTSEYYIGFEL